MLDELGLLTSFKPYRLIGSLLKLFLSELWFHCLLEVSVKLLKFVPQNLIDKLFLEMTK